MSGINSLRDNSKKALGMVKVRLHRSRASSDADTEITIIRTRAIAEIAFESALNVPSRAR